MHRFLHAAGEPALLAPGQLQQSFDSILAVRASQAGRPTLPSQRSCSTVPRPTVLPSYRPTVLPSYRPTVLPSYRPTVPPSHRPTVPPSHRPDGTRPGTRTTEYPASWRRLQPLTSPGHPKWPGRPDSRGRPAQAAHAGTRRQAGISWPPNPHVRAGQPGAEDPRRHADCPPMKAGSHQNIHCGAPSWPYPTEPITGHKAVRVRPEVAVRDGRGRWAASPDRCYQTKLRQWGVCPSGRRPVIRVTG